ncbi:hypothetical protein GYMLUDRAFT_208804 [Collybiopsis luxurians FD-317 M1]|uniref:EF-hand domain-containing protein n=1 Tax=Collybiopsis luxurians FD-317 M1 TaxID=944289 RepID=A0A0D0BNY3_9AGAR|nr:hypothetical protein GYMLUDRAFT_208804 [Collybiopsis luxurians FD-317 M1]
MSRSSVVNGFNRNDELQQSIHQASDINAKFQRNALSKSQTRADTLTENVTDAFTSSQAAYEKINSFYNSNQSAFVAAASSLEKLSSGNSNLVEETISTFTEYCPIIVQGLQSLSQLHPFIGIVCQAFSLVVTVNLTRINNDKKVIALQLQMQDTVMVLFDLRHMKDPDHMDDEGNTIENRMSTLLNNIAEDIKKAGSACDHYMKKSFTLKSFKYENRLTGYGDKFIEYRKQLIFNLSVHTAIGVDVANTKIDRMSAQIEKFAEIIQKVETVREKEAKEFIHNQGGAEVCLQDDQLVQRLINISGEGITAINARRTGDDQKDLKAARTKLLREFSEDLDEALDKNMARFEQKMDMQSKRMQSFIDDSLHNHDRFIISALKAGAYDRIIDVDMQALWKEHDWKGSVKARYFVLALGDFYVDKQISKDTSRFPVSPANPLSQDSTDRRNGSPDAIFKDDRWALKYLDISRVQPILEAIDDDGTGFISIKEVNTFVRSKPDGWSLPVWIAYWAAGWHADMVRYKQKIHAVICEMYRVLDYDTIDKPHLPANRRNMDEYITSPPFTRIDLLLRSLHPLEYSITNSNLKQISDAYSSSEEQRLQENLRSFAYDIDTPETVSLVTGPGRIERFILPLLYLLLKKHLQVFYLAQTHILDNEELWDSITSLKNVFEVLDNRIRNLTAVFKQTVPDVSKRLGNFAYGLLSYVDPNRHPNENSLGPWNQEGQDAEAESESMSADEIAQIPLDILKHGVRDNLESQIYQHSLTTFNPNDQNLHSPLSGYWAGHFWIEGSNETYSAKGLLQISITDIDEEGKITGVAEAHRGLITVSGKIASDNTLSLNFSFDEDGSEVECRGRFDPNAETLTGNFFVADEGEKADRLQGQVKDDDTGDSQNNEPTYKFFFNRTPAFAWRFYTLLGQASKTARDRWTFAINAVLDKVQRKGCSWNYLKSHYAERRRFLDLMVRNSMAYSFTPSSPLNSEEENELRLLVSKIHPTDARFYLSLLESLTDTKFGPWVYTCDSCDRVITRSRFICLICMSEDFAETFELCLNCRDSSLSTRSFNHIPSHAMLKTERVISDGELAWAVPKGRAVAARAKKLFRSKSSATNRHATDGIKDGKPDKTQQTETLCCCCREEVDAPCWVCLSCTPDTYICDACEKERTQVQADGPNKWHEHKHHLIRIHDPEEIPDCPSVESRLLALEGNLTAVNTRLESFEAMLKQLLAASTTTQSNSVQGL